jgi:hypothetical protein
MPIQVFQTIVRVRSDPAVDPRRSLTQINGRSLDVSVLRRSRAASVARRVVVLQCGRAISS